MAQKLDPAYKRGKFVRISNPFFPNRQITVRRLVAVKDIPQHNVKAGDLGGLIQNTVAIRTNSAWISYDAIVLGTVCVHDNTLITDSARVHGGKSVFSDGDSYFRLYLKEDAIISGKSIVNYNTVDENRGEEYMCEISGKVRISEKAYLEHPVKISGNIDISGSAYIGKMTSVTGNSVIRSEACINERVTITGNSLIEGSTKVLDGASISGATRIQGEEIIGKNLTVHDGALIVEDDGPVNFHTFSNENIKIVKTGEQPNTGVTKNSVAIEVASEKNQKSVALDKLGIIKSLIASYEDDIVKLIKFPLMTDLTDSNTAAMIFALKKAESLVEFGSPEKLAKAVIKLEQKTLVAESNARKVASSKFSDEERKKTERARDLFSIAMDEASEKNEKIIAFKAGFRNLEGIVAVPDKTIDAFKIKIGLPELEA